jgi:hypothetical protein
MRVDGAIVTASLSIVRNSRQLLARKRTTLLATVRCRNLTSLHPATGHNRSTPSLSRGSALRKIPYRGADVVHLHSGQAPVLFTVPKPGPERPLPCGLFTSRPSQLLASAGLRRNCGAVARYCCVGHSACAGTPFTLDISRTRLEIPARHVRASCLCLRRAQVEPQLALG